MQVLAVLDSQFGIEAGLVTTVHSYTADQSLIDKPHSDPRRGRAAGVNIIPTTTGAAIASGLVVPHLADRLDGRSLRVPVPDVSMADISLLLGRETPAVELYEALEGAARQSETLALWRGPVVSSDVLGATESAVVDADLTQAVGRLAKIFACTTMNGHMPIAWWTRSNSWREASGDSYGTAPAVDAALAEAVNVDVPVAEAA